MFADENLATVVRRGQHLTTVERVYRHLERAAGTSPSELLFPGARGGG